MEPNHSQPSSCNWQSTSKLFKMIWSVAPKYCFFEQKLKKILNSRKHSKWVVLKRSSTSILSAHLHPLNPHPSSQLTSILSTLIHPLTHILPLNSHPSSQPTSSHPTNILSTHLHTFNLASTSPKTLNPAFIHLYQTPPISTEPKSHQRPLPISSQPQNAPPIFTQLRASPPSPRWIKARGRFFDLEKPWETFRKHLE